jgi:hypothetical protein
MTITSEILNTLERESVGAPVPMLERCIRFVRAGIANASPEAKAHAHMLVLRLEHLVRSERLEPGHAVDLARKPKP